MNGHIELHAIGAQIDGKSVVSVSTAYCYHRMEW